MTKRILVLVALVSLQISAYEYKAGEWLFKGLLGKTVYFAQDFTTSVSNNILTGIELDYMLTPQCSVGGGLKPLFATNRFGFGVAVNGKYRFVNRDIPLVPYVSAGLIPSVLIPTDAAKAHFNLGIRPAGGFEYFIARDLALSIEAGITPSLVFGKDAKNTFESNFELLAGATWRL